MRTIKLRPEKQNEYLEFLEKMQDNPVANKQDMTAFFHLLSPSLKLSTHHFINRCIFQENSSLLFGLTNADMNAIVV